MSLTTVCKCGKQLELDIHNNEILGAKIKPLPKTFFICGFARAGTTVTQAVLDSSPKISVTNEHSYLKMIIDDYWNFIPRYYAEDRSFRQEELELALSLYAKHNINAFFEYHALRKPNAELIGDKLPAYLIHMDWLRGNLDNPKFILCIRNEDDTIKSMKQAIESYKNRDEKYIRNEYRACETIFRKEKDKPDCFVMDMDELHKGKQNEIFDKMAEFLEIDCEFDLELVQKKPE